ncbi:MAG: hypothetical protein V4733_01185 [Verrucomicrobiota bacterium]
MSFPRNLFCAAALVALPCAMLVAQNPPEQTNTGTQTLKNPLDQNVGVDVTVPEWLSVNDDDDNDDNKFDFDVEPLSGKTDTAQVTITATADKSPAIVRVEIIPPGTSKIEGFWAGTLTIDGTVIEDSESKGKVKESAKKTSFTVPAGKSGTQTLYIEGIDHSAAKGDIKIKATLDAPEITIIDQPYRAVTGKTAEASTTAYRLRIKDIPESNAAAPPVGAEIPVTVKHPAIVGVKDAYAHEILPDPSGTKQYKWEINGASPPANTLSIKSYEHAIDDSSKHKRIDLAEADMKNATLEHFWRTESTDGKIKLTLTAGAVVIDKTIKTEAKPDPDPNREIYAPVMSQSGSPSPMENKFRNPNGVNGQYFTNRDHLAWHMRADTDARLFGSSPTAPPDPSNYAGQQFLEFHQEAIAANKAWRATFNVPTIPSGVPTAPDPKPGYLTIGGGNTPHPTYHGYVRLGEALSLKEAGLMTVEPWHNTGHVTIGGDMESPARAIRAAGDVFWQWHVEIDTVRSDWVTDMASVTAMAPVGNNATPAVFKVIDIDFDKPVSQIGGGVIPVNTAGIEVAQFTMDGVPAAGPPHNATLAPMGGDRRKYKLTLAAPLAVGSHTIGFAGSRAINARSVTFEVK